MRKNRKEIIKDLVDFFRIEVSDEEMNYIDQHFDEYFNNNFFKELFSSYAGRIEDIIAYAKYELDILKETEKNSVTFNPEKRTISFDGNEVPAYWYEKGMSDEQIREFLRKYKNMWIEAGFPVYKYPMLEEWYPLYAWEKEFSEDVLRHMERDLENPKSEDAKILIKLFLQKVAPDYVVYEYPSNIQKIIKIENETVDENGTRYADITMKIRDNKQRKVRVFATSDGSFRGMTALNHKGFPVMTSRDIRIIEKEVFKKQSIPMR